MFSEFAKKAGVLGIWQVLTIVVSFLFTLVVANLLGPVEYGYFFIVFAIFEFLLSAFHGLNNATIKYISMTKRWEVAKQILKFEVLIGFVIAVLLYSLAPNIEAYVQKPIADLVRVLAVVFLFRPFFEIFRNVFLGFKKVGYFSLANVSYDILRLVLAYVLLSSGFGAFGALVGVAIATLLSSLLSAVLIGRLQFAKGPFQIKEIVSYTARANVYFIVSILFYQIMLFLVSPKLPAEEIGLLGLMIKLTTVALSIIPTAISLMLLPYLAEQKSNKDMGRLFSVSLTATLLVSLPAAVVVYCALPFILMFFFPQYTGGMSIAAPLIIASIANIATTMVDSLIKGSGNFRTGIYPFAISTTLLAVMVGPALEYGIWGLSISYAAAQVLLAVLLFIFARKYFGAKFVFAEAVGRMRRL